MSTPHGQRGQIDLAGTPHPAVDDGDGWALVEFGTDIWAPTTLPFTPVWMGEHSVWCDRGQLEDMCPDCARTARDSFDLDEVAP